MDLPFKIERHPGWGTGREGTVDDLTPHLRSVSWGGSVSAPWGGLMADVAVPIGVWRAPSSRTWVPRVGDWIVPRTVLPSGAAGPAMGGPYVVVNASNRLGVTDGAVSLGSYRIAAEHWLQHLSRVQVATVHGAAASYGTALTAKERNLVFPRGDASATSGVASPGDSLHRFVQALFRVLPPPSLGGSFGPNANPGVRTQLRIDTANGIPQVYVPLRLGDQRDFVVHGELRDSVRIVHGDAGVSRYAGAPAHERSGAATRVAPEIPGWLLGEWVAAWGSQGASLLELLMGSFAADSALVELFPSLEEPGVGDLAVEQFIDASATVGMARDRMNLVGNGAVPPPSAGEAPAAAKPALIGPLAQALGRQPVLHYRVRPWFSQAVPDFAARNAGVLGTSAQVDPRMFATPTWDTDRAIPVPASDVPAIDMHHDAAEGWTATTIGLPNSPDYATKWVKSAGLPVFASLDAATLGVRVYTCQWPYWPLHPEQIRAGADARAAMLDKLKGEARKLAAEAPDPTQISFMASVRSVAMAAYMVLHRADRFAAGTITCRYRPDIREGEIVAVDCAATAGATLHAYCEDWQHEATVDPDAGTVRLRTTITFSRGLWDESSRAPRFEEHAR